MPTLLVIGASRGVGLETVRQALGAGHAVRAFARQADTIPLTDPGLDKRSGDALDASAIASALTNVDAVVQCLGAAKDLQSIFAGTTLFSRATRFLVDAMRAQGPRRLLVVTGLGAGDSRGYGGLLYDAVLFPLVLKRVYDDKDVQEQIVRSSGLEWTIARPGLLTNAPATGTAQALTDPKTWRAGNIARADVAAFLVREAFERRFVRQTPLLIQ
jgi:putative NADH-flavin reductase